MPDQGCDNSRSSHSLADRATRLGELPYLSRKQDQIKLTDYRKIPKISPGAYIFQRPFFEGLIFGGAYIRRRLSTEGNLRFKTDWASLIVGSKFTVSALFYFVFENNFPSTSAPPPGGGGFCGGAYFWNFTVYGQAGYLT